MALLSAWSPWGLFFGRERSAGEARGQVFQPISRNFRNLGDGWFRDWWRVTLHDEPVLFFPPSKRLADVKEVQFLLFSE